MLSINNYEKEIFFQLLQLSIATSYRWPQVYNWQDAQYSLKKANIENSLFAEELEKACLLSHGTLTYGQYQQIDQFGLHGYHATNPHHGFQPIDQQSVDDIVAFCIQNKIKHVIDFGCGEGNLGAAIIEEAQKKNYSLQWSGIEINEKLHSKIKDVFRKRRLGKHIRAITSAIQPTTTNDSALLLFSYSLDSIPPEIFINTSNSVASANGLIGIEVKHSELSEKVLAKEEMLVKNFTLEKGLFTYSDKTVFDMRSCKLAPMQRAYIPVAAIALLKNAISTYNASSVIIIDEFKLHKKHSLDHIGIRLICIPMGVQLLILL